jgi:hypothetical protein
MINDGATNTPKSRKRKNNIETDQSSKPGTPPNKSFEPTAK